MLIISPSLIIDDSELLVVGLCESSVFDVLAKRSRPEQFVLDLVHLPNRAAIAAEVEGLCW